MILTKISNLRLLLICLLFFVMTTVSAAQEPAAFDIEIERIHDALPGHPITVNIVCNSASEEFIGFEFLLLFETTVLTFLGAVPGEFINRCNWDYFAYRYYTDGYGGNVPTGLLRLTAAAWSNTGSGNPSCFSPDVGEFLTSMTFRITPGCKNRGLVLPIQFYWAHCHDNSLVLASDESLAISRFVYDAFGEEKTDTGAVLPSTGGAPNSCLDNDPPSESRLVDFHHGDILIINSDDICIDRGDLNCDGNSYQAADAVFFYNMFILLLSPDLHPFWEVCSIVNSDVNADGIGLSVADFVYLLRVIIGEVMPYPKSAPGNQSLDISIIRTSKGVELHYHSAVDIGGLMLRCRADGNQSSPDWGSDVCDMKTDYLFDGNHLGMFIYDWDGGVIPSGEGILAIIPNATELEEVDVDASDRWGQVLPVNLSHTTPEFVVSQNRPNPFNPSTEIRLFLPNASAWQITIFNVLGQVVREYIGYGEAGQVSVIWNGRDGQGTPVAGGIYFYKARAGENTVTRKMVLLK